MTLDIRYEIRVATLILAGFLGIFFLWGLFATIESAALAPGQITVASKVKQIQHQEGGTIQAVLVKEGEHVTENQVLIQLDPTQAQASHQLLRDQLTALELMELRIHAELNEERRFDVPMNLRARIHSKELQDAIVVQSQLLRANIDSLREQVDILTTQLQQKNERRSSLEQQIVEVERQQALVKEELVSVEVLAERQLVKKPRLLALKREDARLGQSLADIRGRISTLNEESSELQLKIDFQKNENRRKLLEALEQVQNNSSEVNQRLLAAQDVLKKTKIRSPADGWVLGLAYHTQGEVVRPSEPIMKIVPKDDQYVVEARINPTDIDMVYPGLKAKITLTALNTRYLPTLNAFVDSVSPDVFFQKELGTSYYMAQLSIPEETLAMDDRIKLVPGMPVQVMILNDDRSPLGYLITPLTESFGRAFREE